MKLQNEEKDILRSLMTIFPKLPDREKGYWLGYAAAMEVRHEMKGKEEEKKPA